jgi:hypothetical protein
MERQPRVSDTSTPGLSRSQWEEKFSTHPGLIPIALDAQRLRLTWQDLGHFHFHESFFHRSIELYRALAVQTLARFETPLEVLADDRIPAQAVPLAGIVFHAGRSRSTLLARAIARSRENLVLSEPAALSSMLDILANQPDWRGGYATLLCRNLMLAMCRRRVPTHRRSFVKCSSHNAASHALIRAAFPDVPVIFLTREPAEIVESFRRSPPSWASRFHDVEAVVRSNLDHAARAGWPQLDHRQITADNLPFILARFGYVPDKDQLRLMRAQFDFNSKEDFRREPYPVTASGQPDDVAGRRKQDL